MIRSMTFHQRIELVYHRLYKLSLLLEARRDSRATFSLVYSQMTRRIQMSLDDCSYDELETVTALTETFAEKYIQAVNAYTEGSSCPLAWKYAFDVETQTNTSLLDELLISMYVHISYDLPFALWEVDQQYPNMLSIRDFHQVNDVLEQSIDDIQDLLSKRYSYHFFSIDRYLKNNDEIITNYGIRLSRGIAWYNFQRLKEGMDIEISLARSCEVNTDLIINGLYPFTRLPLKVIRYLLNLDRFWPVNNITLLL